jgi:hypothetical protein
MEIGKGVSFLSALALVLAACGGNEAANDAAAEDATAEQPAAADPDIAPAGAATALPAGFALTLDNPGANASEFRAMPMDGGVHVQTGPAGVLYNATNTVASGDYSVSATFTEIGAPPNHREAFGIVIGGSELETPNQRYTYFLVRADGKYLIKRRTGSETANVRDWTDSEAVQKAEAQGDVTNALEVAVRGDQVHFSINGTEVTTVPVAEVDAHGIAGVRVNHNLNVMVSNWTVTQ